MSAVAATPQDSLAHLVAGAAQAGSGGEPRTKELWRDYVLSEPPPKPLMPPREQYDAMPEAVRIEFNSARARYHSAGPLLVTGDVARIKSAIYDTMLVNQNAPAGARRSIVIDGPAGAGKSTLVKMVAREYERALRQGQPHLFNCEPGTDEHIPVVYLSVPAAATPKMLTVAFADYLNLPMSRSRVRGSTQADLARLVLEPLQRCGTALVIIDDAHFLDCSQKDGQLSNDHLKYLANFCPATFVLVGVDLEHGGLFSEGREPDRATQTAGRFAVHPMSHQAIGTPEEQQAWARTIWAFEESFALYNHTPGQLASKEWRYLHQRSGGRLSTLSFLMRRGAQVAVTSGSEQVTREILDNLITDRSTQRRYEQVAKKPATRRRTKPSSKAS